jgi:hypothetical protein
MNIFSKSFFSLTSDNVVICSIPFQTCQWKTKDWLKKKEKNHQNIYESLIYSVPSMVTPFYASQIFSISQYELIKTKRKPFNVTDKQMINIEKKSIQFF